MWGDLQVLKGRNTLLNLNQHLNITMFIVYGPSHPLTINQRWPKFKTHMKQQEFQALTKVQQQQQLLKLKLLMRRLLV